MPDSGAICPIYMCGIISKSKFYYMLDIKIIYMKTLLRPLVKIEDAMHFS